MTTRYNKTNLLLFVLLMSVFVIHIGGHVNDFYVPESDFFDFRDKAITLRALEWPEHFKRPPLYAICLAAISTALSGQHRELYAAEIIGLAAALAGLLLFYKIAQHFFCAGAIFISWLWAFHPSTIRMAIKPKSEILVTVLILWAFYLFLTEKKSAYILGFLASMVRYEGALIIAAIGLADFCMRRKKIKTILYSILAGLPIVFWTLLQSSGGDSESYFSYFAEYKPNFAFVKSFWDGYIGFTPSHLKLWILLAGFLLMIGFNRGWRTHRREASGLFIFFLGFIFMHIIWPMPNFDYHIIIVWNALLWTGLGIMAVLSFMKTKIRAEWLTRPAVGLFSIFLLAGTLFFLIFIPAPFPQYKVDWRMMLVFFTPVVAALLVVHVPLKKKLAPVSVYSAFLLSILYFMISETNALFYSIRYSKAEFRAVGEWFAREGKATDIMAVEQPIIVGYYARVEESNFIRLTELKNTTPDSLWSWLRDNGVTYIAWMSANRVFETDNAWYQWKMDNRGWKNISFLGDGKSMSGFILVKEISIGPRRAFIYKIKGKQ
ncbi:hypothetical protein EH223_02660 [candidate division KSB1 bacterium]|nr:hypothetical protein [candidate division KSB1 bacterium]RQW06298.1 MAG: hypothetical protein EH223_02660 [candidate division KSB1 bacterium]